MQLTRHIEGETVAAVLPRPLSGELFSDWLDSSTDAVCSGPNQRSSDYLLKLIDMFL